MGVRIRGTLGDMGPLNKVSKEWVKKGYPLRGLPNNTPKLGADGCGALA